MLKSMVYAQRKIMDKSDRIKFGIWKKNKQIRLIDYSERRM